MRTVQFEAVTADNQINSVLISPVNRSMYVFLICDPWCQTKATEIDLYEDLEFIFCCSCCSHQPIKCVLVNVCFKGTD